MGNNTSLARVIVNLPNKAAALAKSESPTIVPPIEVQKVQVPPPEEVTTKPYLIRTVIDGPEGINCRMAEPLWFLFNFLCCFLDYIAK
jgi:hypothetical protein